MNSNRLSILKQELNTRIPHIIDHESYHKSAVLVPLIPVQDKFHVLFEVRSQHLSRQPGEICFPGGGVDPVDKSMEDTAVRETCEELGLRKDQIDLLAPLDFMPTSYHSIIYPFVGRIENIDWISPNPVEVEEVFLVPVQHLLENEPERYDLHLIPKPEEAFPFHLIPKGANYNWRKSSIPEYFYYYKEYVIWGLTARILRHFIQLYNTVE